MPGIKGKSWFLFWSLAAALGLLAGCTSLCTKRLNVYRDSVEKSPPAGLALLITDPAVAQAVASLPQSYEASGCQWAPEQPSYETNCYRWSLATMDGKPIYQGLCMDTPPTYACEVHPGTRQAGVRIDVFGPGIRDKLSAQQTVTLAPGACYFIWPDCSALRGGQAILRVERLPETYDAGRRARLVTWERAHSQGRTME